MGSIFKVEIRSFKEQSEVGLASKKIEAREEEVKRLGSEEEDTFIGGIVVAGCASQKARKKRKKKSKNAREEEVKEGGERIEGEDLKGNTRNLTKEEWKAYSKRVEAKCELENAEEEKDP